MPRLADFRSTITNIIEAKAVFADLAQAKVDLAVREARVEKRITDIKAKHEADTAPLRQRIADTAALLVAFIDNHRNLFQRPRKVKTDFGTFGLRKVTDVLVTDRDALVQALLDRGYHACLKVTRSPIKSAVQEHLEAGDDLPGCHLRQGDTAVHTVSKALIEKATTDATSTIDSRQAS